MFALELLKIILPGGEGKNKVSNFSPSTGFLVKIDTSGVKGVEEINKQNKQNIRNAECTYNYA